MHRTLGEVHREDRIVAEGAVDSAGEIAERRFADPDLQDSEERWRPEEGRVRRSRTPATAWPAVADLMTILAVIGLSAAAVVRTERDSKIEELNRQVEEKDSSIAELEERIRRTAEVRR